MKTKENIGKAIAANENGRFLQIFDNQDHQLWLDRTTERYYCWFKRSSAEQPVWREVEYVISKEKEAWDNDEFDSREEWDWFTDLIAFCEVCGEVTLDTGVFYQWYEIKLPPREQASQDDDSVADD